MIYFSKIINVYIHLLVVSKLLKHDVYILSKLYIIWDIKGIET